MAEKPELVLPSKLPWEALRGEALEELVYWLCDGIGAIDLVWRAGSATGTSRDRGRDIEATFHVEEPDGDFRPQRWWLQVKGRSGTVEPRAVKEAVIDAQASKDLAVLVVATNSRFSNDTRDWAEEYQASNGGPAIKLWDRSQLERMVIGLPSVVARIAPQALSEQGKLEAVSERFWNHQEWPDSSELSIFWEKRDELEFSTDSLVAIIIGEAATETLDRHPWGGELSAEDLGAALIVGLANSGPLLLRFQRQGKETRVLADCLTHLLACALVRFGDTTVLDFITDPWAYMEDQESLESYSRERMRELLIDPIMQRLTSYFGAACAADCVRVSGDLEHRDEVALEDRWLSLVPARYRAEREAIGETLIYEQNEAPCNAGLELSATHGCPFVAGAERDWKQLIPELQTVFAKRIGDRVAAEGTADAPLEVEKGDCEGAG